MTVNLGCQLDTLRKRESQGKTAPIKISSQHVYRAFSLLLVGAGGPSSLWEVLILGRWQDCVRNGAEYAGGSKSVSSFHPGSASAPASDSCHNFPQSQTMSFLHKVLLVMVFIVTK